MNLTGLHRPQLANLNRFERAITNIEFSKSPYIAPSIPRLYTNATCWKRLWRARVAYWAWSAAAY